MKIIFSERAQQDLTFWKTNNPNTLFKIISLIKDIQQNKNVGLGIPKPLSGDKLGWWSRRIDKKHRLVYRIINNQILEIAQCRNHYDDR
jgi:toxin YoeB